MQRLILGVLVLLGVSACAAATPNGSTKGTGHDGSAGAAGDGASAGTSAAGGGSGGVSGGGAGSAGSGGAGGSGLNDCPAVSQTANNEVQPVDIIIAIDTSGSMGDEVVDLQKKVNGFSQQITDSGIDAHVILIATAGDGMSGVTPPICMTMPFDPSCFASAFGGFNVCIGAPLGSGMCPADSKLPQYFHLNQTVNSNDELTVVTSSYPMWKDHLRAQSVKQFLFITDDNADPYVKDETAKVTAQTFIDQVNALDPDPQMFADWKVNGIYSFTQCATAAAIGTVYDELITATKGTRGDLCLQDFKPVFDDIAKQVKSSVKLSCQWDIPAAPAGKKFDRGQTNVKLTLDGKEELIGNIKLGANCAKNQAWYYDIADEKMTPKKVLACPATCDRIQAAPNAKVDVLFDCPTVEVNVQ